nr:hypothetical protein [Tanacetum cinerariifolium]
MKRVRTTYRDENKGSPFSHEGAWEILRSHAKWDTPSPVEPVDLTGGEQVLRVGHEELLDKDAKLRLPGPDKARPAQRSKFETTTSTGGSKSSNPFGKHMSTEFRLKREATKSAYKVAKEKDHTLMRLEEMKFLATRHFKRDYPKLKNKDEEKVNAPEWVYAVGNAEKRGNASRDPNSNVVTSTLLLNNHYASILFDTGADRSFISTAFSSLIDIVPPPLGNSYDVELVDGKIVRVDTIMRGFTLNFVRPSVQHRFNARRTSNNESESRLTVISCSKSQEYMAKGCQIFLAQISAKKEEDKSEGKQLEDVPVVQDYPEVFPKDLPGLPLARPVEF